MKRFFALLLCLMLCLSLIPAAAAEDAEDIPLIEIVEEDDLIDILPNDQMNGVPTITTQPKDVTAQENTTATFTVTASNVTSYQWYFRTSSTAQWTKSSTGTGATLSVEALAYRNGYQYRCGLTNSSGTTYTNTVTLTVATIAKPTITTQPKNTTAYVNSTAKFTAAGSGTGTLSYQWYFRMDSSSQWTKCSNGTGKTLSVEALAYRSGYQYRCGVTNSAGTTYTNTVTLTVSEKPVVITQPKSVTAAPGTTAKFTVTADGATGYQWYYRTSSSGSWSASAATGAKTATLSISAEAHRDGYQYRCKLTNAKGETYTNAATLTVESNAKPTITTQPKSVTAAAGTTAKFTVAASGGTLSYQWYWRSSSSGSWSVSSASDAKTASLSVTAESYRNGYQYRCKVTNSAGYVYSDPATLTVSGKPGITTQPQSIKASTGLTVDFSVKASGATSYQWYWRSSSSGTWSVSSASDAKTATLSVKTEKYRDGYQYRCKVTNSAGYVYTNPATLNVGDKAGSNVFWTLDSAGTIKFTGSGPMYDFYDGDSDTSLPSWLRWGSQIKKATIADGITTIGEYAFDECANLSSVVIPNSVTMIGEAFTGCKKLTSLSIPSGITSRSELSTQFIGCSSLASFKLNGSSSVFSVKDGVLLSADGSMLIRVPTGKTGSYTLPSSVSTIADENYTDYPFENCEKLTALVIPDGVTASQVSFNGCTALENLTIGADLTGSLYFYHNYSMKNVNVSANNSTYSSADGVLCSKTGKTVKYYPTGRQGSYTMPSKVTTIDSDAFHFCTGLTAIQFSSNLVTIRTQAFEGCTGLTTITIPDSVTKLGSYVFMDCTGLTEAYLGTGLSSSGTMTFMGCSALKTATIPGTCKRMEQGLFERCHSLESVTIEEGVEYIGSQCFRECDSLKSITIPSSVTYVVDDSFVQCPALTSIQVVGGSTAYSSYNGVLYNADKSKLVRCPEGKSSCTIVSGCTTIGEYAFYYGMQTSVTIPTSVTLITDSAFAACDGLKDVYYKGSQAQWEAINIGSWGNSRLLNATIHFNA